MKTMGKFEDRLIEELMDDHGPALAGLERPAPHHRSKRPLWMTGGALALAVAGAGIFTLVGGGGSPAYAVTQNSNGTVTLTLADMTGVTGANQELHKLGLPVLVVPFNDNSCSYVYDKPDNARGFTSAAAATITGEGQFTFALDQVPAGDTLVIGAEGVNLGNSKGVALTEGTAKGRPPVCGAPSTKPSTKPVPSGPSGTANSSGSTPGK